MIKSISLLVFLVASINAQQIAKIPTIKYDDISTIKPEIFPTNKDKFNVIEGDEANYQLFVGVVGKATENEKEIFFGKTADFRPFEEKKDIALSAQDGATHSLLGKGELISKSATEGLKTALVGGIAGIFYAALDPYVKEYQQRASMDTQYTYIVEFINKENKPVGKLSILFVADDDDYDEEEILQIIKNKRKDIK